MRMLDSHLEGEDNILMGGRGRERGRDQSRRWEGAGSGIRKTGEKPKGPEE